VAGTIGGGLQGQFQFIKSTDMGWLNRVLCKIQDTDMKSDTQPGVGCLLLMGGPYVGVVAGWIHSHLEAWLARSG